jgi:hypothetical protein
MLSNCLQPRNAPSSTVLRLLGSLIVFKFSHPQNAQNPIEVMLLGHVMLFTCVHSLKALSGTVVTLPLKVILPNPLLNSCDLISAPQSSTLPNVTQELELYVISQLELLQLESSVDTIIVNIKSSFFIRQK